MPRNARILSLKMCVALFFVGCAEPGPTPIIYGTDLCDYCDMTIADKSFGSQLITKKGKAYKYDSIECLAAAEVVGTHVASEIHSRWVTDFNNSGAFLRTEDAFVVATDRQKSPMGVGLVAVSDQTRANDLVAAKGGRVLNWEETKRLVAKTWRLESDR